MKVQSLLKYNCSCMLVGTIIVIFLERIQLKKQIHLFPFYLKNEKPKNFLVEVGGAMIILPAS